MLTARVGILITLLPFLCFNDFNGIRDQLPNEEIHDKWTSSGGLSILRLVLGGNIQINISVVRITLNRRLTVKALVLSAMLILMFPLIAISKIGNDPAKEASNAVGSAVGSGF
jgi:hypothetical protein